MNKENWIRRRHASVGALSSSRE